jgi:hypothetical protein
VVAELETLPEVEIVDSLVSAIAADAFISSLTITPLAIDVLRATAAEPLNDTAEAVISPVNEKFCAESKVFAVCGITANFFIAFELFL